MVLAMVFKMVIAMLMTLFWQWCWQCKHNNYASVSIYKCLQSCCSFIQMRLVEIFITATTATILAWFGFVYYLFLPHQAERESYGSEGSSSDNTEQLEEEAEEGGKEGKEGEEEKEEEVEEEVKRKQQKKARPYKVYEERLYFFKSMFLK